MKITKTNIKIITVFILLILNFILMASLKQEEVTEIIKMRLSENNQKIKDKIGI